MPVPKVKHQLKRPKVGGFPDFNLTRQATCDSRYLVARRWNSVLAGEPTRPEGGAQIRRGMPESRNVGHDREPDGSYRGKVSPPAGRPDTGGRTVRISGRPLRLERVCV